MVKEVKSNTEPKFKLLIWLIIAIVAVIILIVLVFTFKDTETSLIDDVDESEAGIVKLFIPYETTDNLDGQCNNDLKIRLPNSNKTCTGTLYSENDQMIECICE